MASNNITLNMSDETFEYICTSCVEAGLIKEALKYCVECQQYCCHDCLTYHSRISSLKGHSFLDNSSVKSQGKPKSLPAFPTQQCSKHVGKILDMFCANHDVVCCYVCAAEDHKSCKDIMSVSDNIDRLYSKTCTTKATTKLNHTLNTMNRWQTKTQILLQQLQDSKARAIKEVSVFRIKMEEFLKKLEEASIKEIDEVYKKLESQILEERNRCDDFNDDLKNLKQLFEQASENIAQLFVCTILADKKCTTIEGDEKRWRLNQAEVKFSPSEELRSSIEKMKHLGEASAISSTRYNVYEATKTCDMDVNVNTDSWIMTSMILGSCIVDDTVIFADHWNHKLKRFDISSLSLVDQCAVPGWLHGMCKVGEKEVAVGCKEAVHFVSIHDELSLSHSIKMKHRCYGIAYSNDKLYITDESKSLYMYDMSGNILKTVTNENIGRPLFECNNHITFNDKTNRLFVGDIKKGLVCFNAQCDYIETITDPDVRPHGVCVDDYGNVIVVNYGLHTIVQLGGDGQKHGKIVNQTSGQPRCVCIHNGLKKMFVGNHKTSTVEVYNLTWKYE